MAEITNGSFSVAIDEIHASEALLSHVSPPPDLRDRHVMSTEFIHMGFPKRSFEHLPFHSFDGNDSVLSTATYLCPRCSTRVTNIPVVCNVCALQLNSSSHIARSHHHLFPVKEYVEVSDVEKCICQGCFELIESIKLHCQRCSSPFCIQQ